jgi:hypothetical protein
MSNWFKTLLKMLGADPLAPTAALQSRTGYPAALIELNRYSFAIQAIERVELGEKLKPSVQQAVPGLRRWLRHWLRHISPDFSDALMLAMTAKGTGHGGGPGLLADYVAGNPLTAKERQLLSECLSWGLPASMPRGQRGKRRSPRSPNTEARFQLARDAVQWKRSHPRETYKTYVTEEVTRHPLWHADSDSDQDQIIQSVMELLRNKERL